MVLLTTADQVNGAIQEELFIVWYLVLLCLYVKCTLFYLFIVFYCVCWPSQGQTHSAIGKHACAPSEWVILSREIEFPINLQRHIGPSVSGGQPLCLIVRASSPRFSLVFTPRAAFPLTGNWPITSFCLISTNGTHKTDPESEGGGMWRMSQAV